jgi:hypothetical protein
MSQTWPPDLSVAHSAGRSRAATNAFPFGRFHIENMHGSDLPSAAQKLPERIYVDVRSAVAVDPGIFRPKVDRSVDRS